MLGSGDSLEIPENVEILEFLDNSQSLEKKGDSEHCLEILEILQKRPFVHNSVCSQFLEGLFAILAECSQFCLRSF